MKRCRLLLVFCFLLTGICLTAQRGILPIDLRQHNLVKYNTNLYNPALSFTNHEAMSLSVWGRVQWVNVDDSPKTYLINYHGKVGDYSGFGLALFQHNIGLFTDSGGIVNYSRGIQLSRNAWLTFGVNVFAYKQSLNQASLITPTPDPSFLQGDEDFIIAVMPGINLTVGSFDMGFSSENLFDYNLTDSEQHTSYDDKIFLGHISYSFTLENNNEMTIRPTAYGKSIPYQDFQYGGNILLDVPAYGWLHAGYNNFYGISGGVGVKVTEGVSVGFVYESGTDSSSRVFGDTYEAMATIEFAKRERPHREQRTRTNKVRNTPKRNQSKEIEEQKPAIEKDIERDTIAREKVEKEIIETKPKTADVTKKENLPNDKLFDESNPRYKTVEQIEGEQRGFYLVANVFSQKKYFEAFVKGLKNRGLNPEYFFNNENSYYYVYLKKYDKLSEAEHDKNNDFNGLYNGEMWILWVRYD
ncbi:PorP/SprF family type IX secretion system membrane protein [Leptobacterium sp. I13]|uniref:PorP/SprF family type IX secretion system membrane protein n=1 Tax=Leptobacterium meishanense TaxID=3128904 RepID=UPI0030ED9903